MTNPVAELVNRLSAGGFDPRLIGNGSWESRCPAHQGSRHNLSVKRGDDGRALVYCHHIGLAGVCTIEGITSALGMAASDLFTGDAARTRAPRPGTPKPSGRPTAKPPRIYPTPDAALKFLVDKMGRPTGRWDYVYPDGRPAFSVYRLDRIEPGTGERSKSYRPVHPRAGGWALGDPEGPLPLYRLPDLVGDARIYVVEGEKAADILRGRLGVVVTTAAHGAQSPRKTDWSPLAGRDVVLLPDNDPAGEAYAQAVAGLLASLEPRPSIRVVRLADLWRTDAPIEEGADAEEWLKDGIPGEADVPAILGILEGMAEAAPPVDLAKLAPAPPPSPTRREKELTHPALPPGTRVKALDRDNFGEVVQDLGHSALVHFISPSGHKADKELRKSLLEPIGGWEEAAEGDEWPPLDLGELPAAEPFPVDVFPEVVADHVELVSKSIGDRAPDFAGLTALIVAGAAIGRSASLVLKPGYTASAALYGMNVGDASSGKSPALDALVRPMWRADEALAREYQRAKLAYDDEMQAFADAPKGEKPPRPVKPVVRSAVLEDVTVEAIAPRLAANPRGLLVSRDEGTAWAASIGQYKNGRGSDRQFWLSALFGKPIRVDRKGHADSEPIRVPRSFLSVVGNLTPGMLNELSERQGRSDGFLERILFAWPEARPRAYWSEEGVPDEADAGWSAIVERLRSRPMEETPDGPGPHAAQFDGVGKAAWVVWYNEHVDEVNDPGFDAADLAAEGKLCDFAGRFVLILHLLHLAADEDFSPYAPIPPVGIAPVKGAIALWSYFRAQHRRVRWQMGRVGNESAGDILGWIKRNRHERFTVSELTDNLRRASRSPGEPEKTLQWLCDRGAIRRLVETPRPGGTRGRKPSPTFQVNPALLGPG